MNLNRHNNRINIELTTNEVNADWTNQPSIHIRVNDPSKARWTDCWIDVTVANGRVKFITHHEKGYPSENKGTIHKSVTASWLSNTIPTVQ